ERLLTPPRASAPRVPAPTAAMTIDARSPAPFANEPHAELRRPGPRRRATDAVARAKARTVIAAPVIIGGAPVATDGVIESPDPSDASRVVCESGRAGVADVDHAIDVAVAAWPEWRARSWDERAGVLFRAAALLRLRRGELAALEVIEAGKPIP